VTNGKQRETIAINAQYITIEINNWAETKTAVPVGSAHSSPLNDRLLLIKFYELKLTASDEVAVYLC
jgi:hypothetical protein